MKWTAKTVGAAALAVVLAMPVVAQNYEEGDDPDHGVARLSLLSGDVTIRRGDTGEVVAGERNAPLVALDHVFTGPGSRAEVQFDASNMIRLGPVSEVRIGDLRAGDYLVQIAEGLTTFRVLRETSAYVEISTPTVSIRPAAEGTYRVLVHPDGTTEITVRGGQAEIFTPRGSEMLRSGKTMVARGRADNPEFMISSAIPSDDWDRWNHDRDRDLEKTSSYQYTSRSIYGVEELDGYGRWVYDSPYGWVWVPSVASSWAPYRVGRWSYIDYYGWTWVSGDPWGWAPYHYGNWYSSPYGWAWYPGAIQTSYYWRPALVTFFGWGSGGISVGTGWNYANVGWVPLAPYEIYRPWYGSRRGVTVVNNITVVNIVDNYRNARVYNGRDGVTCVESTNFGRGGVTSDNYVRVNERDLNRAGRVDGGVPLDQTRESRRFSDRTPGPEVAKRAERVQERQFATSATTGGGADRGARRAAATEPVTRTAERTSPNSNSNPSPAVRPAERAGVERSSVSRTDGSSGSQRSAQADSTQADPALSDRTTRIAASSAREAAPSRAPAAAPATAPTEGWRRFEEGTATQPSRTDRAARPSPANDARQAQDDRGRRQAVEVAPNESRRASAPAVTTTPSAPVYAPPASSRREVAPDPRPAPTPRVEAPRVEAPRIENRRAEAAPAPAPAPAPRIETRRAEPAPQVSAPPPPSRAAERSAVPSAPPPDNGRRSASPSPEAAPASNGRESSGGGGDRRRWVVGQFQN